MDKDLLTSLLLKGDFAESYKIVSDNDVWPKLEGLLLEIADETENITVYSFACFLLRMNESVELHITAFMLISQPLCFISGAYATGLYHVRRAIELDPMDASIKELILFYYLLPEDLITKEEAINCANEILLIDPNNKAAIDFLSRYR